MILQNTRDQPEVLSFMAIRRIIGVLGMAIPFVLLAGGLLLGCHVMMPSISHYYFTYMGTMFTGTLCAVGLFLITYKGFGPLDDAATNFAGFSAFGVALFPTTRPDCDIFGVSYPAFTPWVHYTCAALFFVTLALISIFLFTRTNPGVQMTKPKVTRNKIYRFCGWVMLVFIVLAPITSAVASLTPYNPTFWCETGALLNFGISWLVKGEVVLKG